MYFWLTYIIHEEMWFWSQNFTKKTTKKAFCQFDFCLFAFLEPFGILLQQLQP